jgi:hypothetical protein
MRTITTAVVAAVAAIPFALLTAAPATAAVGDVTAVFTPGISEVEGSPGYTITGTFTVAPGSQLSDCVVDLYFSNGEYAYSNFEEYYDDMVTQTVQIVGLPADTYTIGWGCTGTFGSDGTNGVFGATGYREMPTLVVPAVGPEEPEPEVPGCTGSVCLPTGSFGF